MSGVQMTIQAASVIPTKTVMWAVGAFLSGATLAIGMFSVWIGPAIMREVIREIDNRSVSRPEFTMLQSAITDRLDTMAADVRAISVKIDRLHGG